MLGAMQTCPEHIKELLAHLKQEYYADKVLTRFLGAALKDSLLKEIYLDLGALEQSPKCILSSVVISKIRAVYGLGSESPVLGSPVFSKNYCENHIDLLYSPLDLAANLQETTWFSCEDSSLSAMWSECSVPTEQKEPQKPKSHSLKALSFQIKQIVQKQENASYKSVSEEVLSRLNCSSSNEKNVRRRIYDALNVLVAVGIFEKTYKKFKPKDTQEVPNIETKKSELLKLAEYYNTVKNIVCRNKGTSSTSQKCYLPFKLLVVGKQNSPVNIETSIRGKVTKIAVGSNYRILDSKEVVNLVHLNQAECFVPPEIWEVCKTK